MITDAASSDQELVDRYLDGLATPEETARLWARIGERPELADQLVGLVELESHLGQLLAQGEVESDLAELAKEEAREAAGVRPASTRLFSARLWIGMAAGLLFGVCLWNMQPVEQQAARLVRSEGSVWSSGALAANSPLRPGVLSLEQGLAEIVFGCGTAVVLEAPARIELIDGRRARLHAGNVVVRTSGPADRFELWTGQATVEHDGTEFGVGVSDAGMVIQVFEGAVTASWKSQAGPRPERVAAGEARQFDHDGAPRALAFREERFVRTLPELAEFAFRGEPPRNDIQVETVRVLPARNVRIDGALTDWDLAGQFTTRLNPPYSEAYYVEGAMQYDARAIYIAAHVGDPHPMASIMDAGLDPDYCWKGGSVQVRLGVDRRRAWPLVGMHPIDRADVHRPKDQRAPSPEDTAGDLLHITMWHHQPTGKASLTVQFGLDLHAMLINPAGYEGAFRRDADGRGYTLEYAIPWSVLQAAHPPQAGDVLGANWQVHWSDQSGRLWRGHLVDVLRPGVPGLCFRNAATWGRAVYEGNPKSEEPNPK